ncbi:MAG TPA: hypothetical protein VFO10_26100 [Oligoflexus sp.]|uniref:hypothetical protein n=1 Tax=Oligoflexus sp. TaxID=1971216 RepID=UPI002D7EC719|nr:hypothetical protein [Oligoflexus sp.]HET9240764.1 hypothetical protein [Oligoflexus sp.]
MLWREIKKRFKELDKRNKSGLILSLFGVVGWSSAIGIIYFFGLIFNQPPQFNVSHFIIVPSALIIISIVLNSFELNKRWGINPNNVTVFLTNLHGIWGLYVSLQINSDYNGYVVLFLFSFGLLFIKGSFGFWATLTFAMTHLILAGAMLLAMNIKIGTDEYIFVIFFALYGTSSAFVNEFNRRRNFHLKSVIAQRRHGYEQLEKILFPHQITQIASGSGVEDTLPIQQGYGCCVMFEVVDSADIKHEMAQEYIREIFRLFSVELRKSYDGNSQTCSGFRVIELNNRFVCSVGFPFHCPGHERPSRVSLEMAKIFIQIFQERILQMDYHRPIHCAVVIAAGELEGFFTRGFPIEYHLHGEPLIKADHINELSKQARKSGVLKGSAVVIEDRVYNSLRSQERLDFKPLDIQDHETDEGDRESMQKFYSLQVLQDEAQSQGRKSA